MPITRPLYSEEERQRLFLHLNKHKLYPFRYRLRKTTSAANFATSDSSLGSYTTYTFRPNQNMGNMGIVAIAASMVVTPNTTVGLFAIEASYKSTMTMGDNGAAATPDDEGADIYRLASNGGAINDFQVFYPLNWYIEKGVPFYLHFWADASTITAGTAVMTAQVTLGCLLPGN